MAGLRDDIPINKKVCQESNVVCTSERRCRFLGPHAPKVQSAGRCPPRFPEAMPPSRQMPWMQPPPPPPRTQQPPPPPRQRMVPPQTAPAATAMVEPQAEDQEGPEDAAMDGWEPVVAAPEAGAHEAAAPEAGTALIIYPTSQVEEDQSSQATVPTVAVAGPLSITSAITQVVQTTGAAKPGGSALPPPPPQDTEMTEAGKKRKANAAPQLSKKAEVSKKKD
jgi:hypothetical protein